MGKSRTPHRLVGAIGLSIAIWIAFVIMRSLTRRFLEWPAAGTENAFMYFVMAVSAAPLVLLLLEFIATRAGVVRSTWLTIDFSKAVLEEAGVRKESFGFTDNIVAEEERITDSGGMKIKST